MVRRVGLILLIAFQVLFLNVVVPGHTRGVITLSGRASSATFEEVACGSCCQKREDPAGKSTPTPKDRSECAICFIAARITPPPVVDFRLTMLGLRDLMPLPPPAAIVTPDVPLSYDGRAPPLA